MTKSFSVVFGLLICIWFDSTTAENDDGICIEGSCQTLENYLIEYGFQEYDKIRSDIESDMFNIDDMIESSESELHEMLADHQVTVMQRKRFIKAISIIKQSVTNAADTGTNDNLDQISEWFKLTETEMENMAASNNKAIEDAKMTLKSNFEQLNSKLTSIAETETKVNQSKLEKLKQLKNEYNKIMISKDNCMKTSKMDDCQIEFQEKMLDFKEKKLNDFNVILNKIEIDLEKIEISVISNEDKTIENINVNNYDTIDNVKSQKTDITIKFQRYLNYFIYNNLETQHWQLTNIVCSNSDNDEAFENMILNDGQTFDTNYYGTRAGDCLAHTNKSINAIDFNTINLNINDDNNGDNNNAIYKILWKVEMMPSSSNRLQGIGICTNFYFYDGNDGNDDTDEYLDPKSWYDELYHIGWDNKGGSSKHGDSIVWLLLDLLLDSNKCDDSGLLCTKNNKENKENIFFKTTIFKGDPLPKFEEGDIIGLIYDSNKQQLLFEKNGKLLNSKLTNFPTDLDLYWFVATTKDDNVRYSIVNHNTDYFV